MLVRPVCCDIVLDHCGRLASAAIGDPLCGVAVLRSVLGTLLLNSPPAAADAPVAWPFVVLYLCD